MKVSIFATLEEKGSLDILAFGYRYAKKYCLFAFNRLEENDKKCDAESYTAPLKDGRSAALDVFCYTKYADIELPARLVNSFRR